jgi:hypothetical protein
VDLGSVVVGRSVCVTTPHRVGRTLRISCEAVPPSIWRAGAQGGTSACHTGVALSFVSCIRLLGGGAPYDALSSDARTAAGTSIATKRLAENR